MLSKMFIMDMLLKMICDDGSLRLMPFAQYVLYLTFYIVIIMQIIRTLADHAGSII